MPPECYKQLYATLDNYYKAPGLKKMCKMEGIDLGKTNQKKKIIDILLLHMLPSPQLKEYLESTASLKGDDSGDDGDNPNDEDYNDNDAFDDQTWVPAKARSQNKKKSRMNSPLRKRQIIFDCMGPEKSKVLSLSDPLSPTNPNKKIRSLLGNSVAIPDCRLL